MTWRTHAVVAANAVWITALVPKWIDSSVLVLLPAAAFAGLLADIDAGGFGAKIHYIKGPGRLLRLSKGMFVGKYFHHRGMTHSIVMALIIFFAVWLFARESLPALAPVFALAYFSHSLADAFNGGVGFFFPFNLRMVTFVPKRLWTKVDGTADHLLMAFASFSLIIYALIYAQQFWPHKIPWIN